MFLLHLDKAQIAVIRQRYTIVRFHGHAFHAQQGVECQDCPGNCSLHVEGGGDKSKIVGFAQRPPRNANDVCLGCHAQDAKVRHWSDGSDAVKRIRCTDCHRYPHISGSVSACESGRSSITPQNSI